MPKPLELKALYLAFVCDICQFFAACACVAVKKLVICVGYSQHFCFSVDYRACIEAKRACNDLFQGFFAANTIVVSNFNE